MAGPAIFYYDLDSPYAYLAAERIDDMIPGVEWRPIAFPILLERVGRLKHKLETLDPAAVAAEIAGRSADRGLPPFAPSEGWPFESWSLTPLRAALVAEEHGRLREFSRAAFRKSFVESRPLADLDNTLAVAAAAAVDADAVREGIGRPEIKERLKAYTVEAIERGVTGIPTVAVGDELFWGDDRLEEAASSRKPSSGLEPETPSLPWKCSTN